MHQFSNALRYLARWVLHSLQQSSGFLIWHDLVLLRLEGVLASKLVLMSPVVDTLTPPWSQMCSACLLPGLCREDEGTHALQPSYRQVWAEPAVKTCHQYALHAAVSRQLQVTHLAASLWLSNFRNAMKALSCEAFSCITCASTAVSCLPRPSASTAVSHLSGLIITSTGTRAAG